MPRLPVFLFVATLAAACCDDGDDEDAVKDFKVEDLEILSVKVADEATVMITYAGSHRGTDTTLLKREDGRWLIGAR